MSASGPGPRRTVIAAVTLALMSTGLGAASASPPAPTLRYGSAAQAGLTRSYVDELVPDVTAGLAVQPGSPYQLYPGAVVLAARHGVIAEQAAVGYAVKYADDTPTELPPSQWVPTRIDTIYDLASVSKLFTSIVAVQQLQAGRIHLDDTVASYLPEFARNGKSGITIRQLLTHTSGLIPDPVPSLWQGYSTIPERVAAVYATVPSAPPGTAYVYSDINMIVMAWVCEKVTGRSLDRLVHDGITAPLGMRDTMYNPPASLLPRIAATEDESYAGRGMVRGSVHDENAWALGGVAGHAGVFSTAHDLAVLAQTILNGGAYGRSRVLSSASTKLLLTNYNQAFPGNDHGLGFELYQYFYMGAMSTPYTAGHTGYTGTDLVIDPTTGSFAILLTNRVHPSRNGLSVNTARRAVTDDVARAVPVRPLAGRTAWYGGMVDASTASLTVPASGATGVSFGLWYDTEPSSDFVHLQSSVDGTTWTDVPFTLQGGATGPVSGWGGRHWWTASAAVPAGAVSVRWTYTTDTLYHGRGVYVDAVRLTAGHRVVLDGERHPEAFTAVGFTPSST